MNRKANRATVIAAIILSVIALIANVASAVVMAVSDEVSASLSPINWVGIIVNTLSFVLALVYLFSGYGKENAIWYKAFVGGFCLALVVAIISAYGMDELPAVLVIMMLAAFAIMLILLIILAVKKDLRKVVSLSLAVLNMLLPVIIIIFALVVTPMYFSGSDTTGKLIAVSFGRFFILAFVLYAATKSKYVDKAERASK